MRGSATLLLLILLNFLPCKGRDQLLKIDGLPVEEIRLEKGKLAKNHNADYDFFLINTQSEFITSATTGSRNDSGMIAAGSHQIDRNRLNDDLTTANQPLAYRQNHSIIFAWRNIGGNDIQFPTSNDGYFEQSSISVFDLEHE